VIGLRAEFSITSVVVLLALLARRSVVALIPGNGDVAQHLTDAHAEAFLDLTSCGEFKCHPVEHLRHPLLDRLRVANDGGLVIFTSGSTGKPKAALHSTERFLRKFRKSGRRFRTLAFLLFDHVAGLDTLFYTLASGGTLILTQRRDPSSILDLIEFATVEVLPASPSFFRLLRASGYVRGRDLSGLKVITYGSDPMDPSTLEWLNTQFPNVQVIQKYGTTEIGSPKSRSRGNDSLWLEINVDGFETKVVEGVLWIRSECAMLGYLNAPSSIDDEGWYCTGDMVERDGSWVRFCGRAVEMINVGGEKVAAPEVEHSILELDFVREVVVTGEPHRLMGQVVTARVALALDSIDVAEAAERIRRHCRRRLAPHKVPVKINFTGEGFSTARQKMQRT
jgi:acyl-coenzyme A synthetase/AMP-(fatty) acid ligase